MISEMVQAHTFYRTSELKERKDPLFPDVEKYEDALVRLVVRCQQGEYPDDKEVERIMNRLKTKVSNTVGCGTHFFKHFDTYFLLFSFLLFLTYQVCHSSIRILATSHALSLLNQPTRGKTIFQLQHHLPSDPSLAFNYLPNLLLLHRTLHCVLDVRHSLFLFP